MKPPAQRKRDERERMRALGLVLRQFWVHPQDWPRVQKYLARGTTRRDISQYQSSLLRKEHA